MSSKPETTYIAAVHRLLCTRVHREKMFNPYRGGTADVWYSGTLDDLWVEYKYVAKVPKKATIDVSKLLSPLQLDWLNKRALEGRNVVVVLGTPVGSWVYEGRTWNGQTTVTHHDLMTLGRSRQEIADYIRKRVMLHESD